MNRSDVKISRAAMSFVRRKESLRQEFEEAALPNLNHIYRAAYYLTRNEAEADDLVQETYLKAFRCFYQFRPGTNCRGWLLTILRSLFLNNCDRKKRQPEAVDWDQIDRTYDAMIGRVDRNDQGNDPESLILSRVTDPQITEALRGLPEEYRSAIILVDIEELTYDEAAQVIGCPVGTVRSRISRGRRLLQVALKDYAAERGLIKS